MNTDHGFNCTIGPKFRFLRKSWEEHTPWILAPFVSDEEAAAMGYAKAGFGRSAESLTVAEQEELFHLLKSRSGKHKDRLVSLLGRCGYCKYLGIIDIDINTQSSAYNAEEAKTIALEYVRQLAKQAPDFGLGNPSWYSSSFSGGFHANLICPEEIVDTRLLSAVKSMVVKLAENVGIPIYSKFSQIEKDNKLKRVPVYLDDSVLVRYPESKGSLWRLDGTAKPNGKPKTLVNPLLNNCPEIQVNTNFTPIDSTALLNVLSTLEIPLTKKHPEAISISSYDIGCLSEDDFDFIQSNPPILNIWTKQVVSDRSHRDFDLVLNALLLGADDTRACRLLHAMPGSKAKQDRRNIDYNISILKSAKRCLATPYTGFKLYDNYIRPRDYNSSEKQIILEASDLAEDKIRKKLLATTTCGETIIRAEYVETGQTVYSQIKRCERSTCAHCELKRIYINLNHAKSAWPKRLLLIELGNNHNQSLQQLLVSFKQKLARSVGKKAKKLLTRIRTFRTPEGLIILYPSTKQLKTFTDVVGSDNVGIYTRNNCIEKVKNALYSRYETIINCIKSGNAEMLASNIWAGHIVSTSGGRKSRRRLDWLRPKEVRAEAKKHAEASRGLWKKEELRYWLLDRKTGKPLKMRESEPFSSKEIRESYFSTNTDSWEKEICSKPPD